MGGGELFDSLVEQGPMSERQAAQVTRKLASALKYMHKCVCVCVGVPTLHVHVRALTDVVGGGGATAADVELCTET